MKLALIDDGDYARGLAEALAAAGHTVTLVPVRPSPALEWLLERRGFTGSLSSVPGTLADLRGGDFELVHAFRPVATIAAHAWRRTTGRPVVFTCTEELDRATVADRRLRLYALSRAVEESDALLAAGEAVRESLVRWMAAPARVMAAADAAGHDALYRDLLA